MTQEEIEILHGIVKGDSWKLVEKVVKLYTASLVSLDGIDATLSGDDMRVEILARKRAKDTIEAFMRDFTAYGLNEKPTTPLTRSMR